MNSQLGKFCKTTASVRQGCFLLSPTLFNLFLEKIMQKILHDTTHLFPLVEGPSAAYDLPTTSILWTAKIVNFKTSLTDS